MKRGNAPLDIQAILILKNPFGLVKETREEGRFVIPAGTSLVLHSGLKGIQAVFCVAFCFLLPFGGTPWSGPWLYGCFTSSRSSKVLKACFLGLLEEGDNILFPSVWEGCKKCSR